MKVNRCWLGLIYSARAESCSQFSTRKRCFRQLDEQFGNSLYNKEIARIAGVENATSIGHGSNGNGRSGRSNGQVVPHNSTASQLIKPQYQDGVAVDTTNTAELEAFNAFRSANKELYPVSRDALRNWAVATMVRSNSILWDGGK
jgi:hypothetical protein